MPNITAKYLTPILWRVFPSRKLKTAQLFSSVEVDSCWQLLQAIPHFRNPEIQFRLFENACEELRHGSWFEDEFTRLSDKRLPLELATRKPVLPESPTEKDLREFLLFFHLGESAVCEKFHALSESDIDPNLKRIFKRISVEETQHGSGCLDLIGNVPENELKSSARRLWWKQKKDDLIRIMSKVQLPLQVLLTAIYFLSGLFLRRQMRSRFFMNRDDQLAIFQEQVRNFEEELRQK